MVGAKLGRDIGPPRSTFPTPALGWVNFQFIFIFGWSIPSRLCSIQKKTIAYMCAKFLSNHFEIKLQMLTLTLHTAQVYILQVEWLKHIYPPPRHHGPHLVRAALLSKPGFGYSCYSTPKPDTCSQKRHPFISTIAIFKWQTRSWWMFSTWENTWIIQAQ